MHLALLSVSKGARGALLLTGSRGVKSEISCGVAVSKPTTSSIPGSAGSTIEKPFETMPTTTSRARCPTSGGSRAAPPPGGCRRALAPRPQLRLGRQAVVEALERRRRRIGSGAWARRRGRRGRRIVPRRDATRRIARGRTSRPPFIRSCGRVGTARERVDSESIIRAVRAAAASGVAVVRCGRGAESNRAADGAAAHHAALTR